MALTPEEKKDLLEFAQSYLEDNWEAHDDWAHVHEEPGSDMYNCENQEEHNYLVRIGQTLEKAKELVYAPSNQ